MMRTWVIRLLLLNVAIGAIWLGLPFLKSSGTQALDQQRRLLDHASHRNWPKILALIAADYHDAWDMDRDEAVAVAHELLQNFLVLNLEMRDPSVAVDGKNALVTAGIKVSGVGTGIGAEIMARTDRLQQPFVFSWRKEGWKPSDWHLTGVAQAELGGAAPAQDAR